MSSVWYDPEINEIRLYFTEYWAGFAPSKTPQNWIQLDENSVFICLSHPKSQGLVYVGEL